jgi:hypothetical protein
LLTHHHRCFDFAAVLCARNKTVLQRVTPADRFGNAPNQAVIVVELEHGLLSEGGFHLANLSVDSLALSEAGVRETTDALGESPNPSHLATVGDLLIFHGPLSHLTNLLRVHVNKHFIEWIRHIL